MLRNCKKQFEWWAGPKRIDILPFDTVGPSQTAESSNWLFDPNVTSLIVQGDEEKSGTILPVKDEEFTGSSLFLTLTIITMSHWYLSNEKL
jgi:hypothetical protein